MSTQKYSIGLDFGTLAGRAILVNNTNGEEVSEAVFQYRNAIISEYLPNTTIKLATGYALHDPRDYIEAVPTLLKELIDNANINSEDVVGIGVDATASTIIPLDDNYEPVCFQERFRDNPHAWIKLWKHSTTQSQAQRLNAVAKELGEPCLNNCGGKISAEWYWPKMMEVAEEAPEVFRATAYFVELGDWIVYLLTGKRQRGEAIAAIHGQWDKQYGYPSLDCFKRVNPLMAEGLIKNQRLPILPLFARAGYLTADMALKTGLSSTTAVSTANSDSPISLLGLGITGEHKASLVLGTSSVLIVLSKQKHFVQGAMASSVPDAAIPGFYSNNFGQPAVGDVFDWFVNHMVPYKYYLEAADNNQSIFQVLNRRIATLKPGQSGLVALEWLNGNRSILQNMDLSGLIVGLSLTTTTECIYRSLVEATAFGIKKMIRAAEQSGITINEIHTCGGIAKKSPEIMQIYCDILEMPMYTVTSNQVNAHGSAIMGAVAAGADHGGYDSVTEAVNAMRCAPYKQYEPNVAHQRAYRELFAHYEYLHQLFGQNYTNLMVNLKKQRNIYK
jgi:L-ribulokinase